MDWECMDMRVGKFVKVSSHPDSEKLYLEFIDLGNEEVREILSGVKK